MILIYTGNGKGKTSACVGQSIRALGQGLVVAFGQFMKKDKQAGEQSMLARLLEGRFHAAGKGFLKREEDRPEHRKAAEALLTWAESHIARSDMLVLDETLYALAAELITREEILHLITLARQHDTHLVLSGRGLPDWLRDEADLVTEMTEIKHPWQQGIKAQRGIEF